jgi:hypothetical protein
MPELNLDWVTLETVGCAPRRYRFQIGKNYQFRHVQGSVTIEFGVSCVHPFQIEGDVAPNGEFELRVSTMLPNLSHANKYVHICPHFDPPESPTNEQIDALISWSRKSDRRSPGNAPILEGWEIDFSLGGTIQAWMQKSEYGSARLREHFTGVALA